MTTGFVSLVGGGPGDPGLLTLAGRDRLAEADVVIYDRLVNPQILKHAPGGSELVYAGKSSEGHVLTQDQINDLLVAKARAGKRVVRLKGGDPFVFGRGGEEALALAAAGIPFEVVPGVTSAIAAPAYAGVPVTHRGIASSFAVITGHEDDTKEEASVDWSKLATAVDTLVILMGGAALASIAEALMRHGRSPQTPAVSIEWGTTAEQRTVAAPLERIAAAVEEAGLGAPLLTVVGEVAALRDHVRWFDSRPLFGKRVLVTRTREQASALSGLLRREGAMPIELPTLEIKLRVNEKRLERLIEAMARGDYDWLAFTSANAVDIFIRFMGVRFLDARAIRASVASIGEATSGTLVDWGILPDLEPEPEAASSEGLLETLLARTDVRGQRFLFPHAAAASDVLVAGLESRGASVHEIVLYEAVPPAHADPDTVELLRAGKIDVATFASSSSVRNLASLLGSDFAGLDDVVVACIGPATAAMAREMGLTVQVEPAEHTIPALVAALRGYYERPDA